MLATTGIRVCSGVATSPFRRNLRWAIHGIGAELLNNAFVQPLSIAFKGSKTNNKTDRIVHTGLDTDDDPNNNVQTREIAIVTGATGGIGTQICHGLLSRNYHVFVLARNVPRGQEFANSLGPHATFIEYHADRFDDDSGALIRAVGNKPVAVLVNNAGTMGGPKSDTIKVNLLGPTVLTLSLLSSFKMQLQQKQQRGGGIQDHLASTAPPPVVVNVGSSSHLRADKLNPQTLESNEIDTNLAAYAESKLGLMQFSNIVRSAYPWLPVIDAHPGLVWTPLLQNNFPKAKLIERIGLAKVLYKTPKGGASTILAAVDEGRRLASLASSSSSKGRKRDQVYFANGKAGGYASEESRDETASIELWRHVLGPVVRKVDSGVYNEVHANLVVGGMVVDGGDSSVS